MQVPRLAVPALYLLSGIMIFAGCGQVKTADMVIRNGAIYTMDDAMPTAGAVGVIDGKIAFVGSDADVETMIGPDTEILDLQGRTMTPGIIESHGHLMSQGRSRMELNLNDVGNYDELLERVAEAVRDAQPGEWIVGGGWHQSKWDPEPSPMVKGFQTHHALSRVSPDNPVYLDHASGHAGFSNAKAMEIAGVTRDTEFTEGGEILKDDRGNPTGIFNERAQDLITRHIPESTPETERQSLEMAIQDCLENGITSFHDAGQSQASIDLYKEFLEGGKLKIRLYVMISGRDEEMLERWLESGPERGLGNNFLTISSIKLVADGALGSRGAWLLESYTDRAGHTGHETVPMDYVYKVSQEALQHGFQVAVHCIGDRANREVLDQYEKAFMENPEGAQDHRFRIEHAQHLSVEDIPRFGELGVIASMQGIHMASDRPWAIDRLGRERIVEGAYVWQKLFNSGAKIINGTDVPVEPVNPIACFYASVTRRTLKGTPPGGYEPDQKMSREEALRSYTLDAAYGAFEEGIKGSIEVGKLADFTVFSQDIMRVPDDDLLNTAVDYTIIDGKILYKRPPLN
ncbi:amidohydrolase [candidate division KSB1 bacterium]